MTNPGTPTGNDWEALAEQPLDRLDAAVLDRVATLYDTVDPVPDDLVERLQFAISLNALEFELAVLQLSSEELLTNRADAVGSVQSLTFTSGQLTTTVTISADGPDRVRVDGWIAPGGAATIELHQGEDHRETQADEDGRFVFAEVRHGLTRFMIRPVAAGPQDRPVVTPAVEI